jgi:hypothetical protein
VAWELGMAIGSVYQAKYSIIKQLNRVIDMLKCVS